MTRRTPGLPRTGRPSEGGFLRTLREKAPVWGAFVVLAVAATLFFLAMPTPVTP